MRCVWILLLLAFVSSQARHTSDESSIAENAILSEGDSSLGSSESDEDLDYFRFRRDLNTLQGDMTDNDAEVVAGDDSTSAPPNGDATTRRTPRRRGGNRRNGHRRPGSRRHRCRPGDNSRRCRGRGRRPSTDAPAVVPEETVL